MMSNKVNEICNAIALTFIWWKLEKKLRSICALHFDFTCHFPYSILCGWIENNIIWITFFYWYSQCVRHTSGFLTILSVSVCTKLITNKLIIITRASNTCRLAESSSLLLWGAKSFEINSNGLGLLLLWSSVLRFVNIFWKERRLEMFLTMCQWQTIFRLLILLHYSNKYQGEHLEKSIKKCGFAFNLYVHSS